jgi:hypothetical protein
MTTMSWTERYSLTSNPTKRPCPNRSRTHLACIPVHLPCGGGGEVAHAQTPPVCPHAVVRSVWRIMIVHDPAPRLRVCDALTVRPDALPMEGGTSPQNCETASLSHSPWTKAEPGLDCCSLFANNLHYLPGRYSV